MYTVSIGGVIIGFFVNIFGRMHFRKWFLRKLVFEEKFFVQVFVEMAFVGFMLHVFSQLLHFFALRHFINNGRVVVRVEL